MAWRWWLGAALGAMVWLGATTGWTQDLGSYKRELRTLYRQGRSLTRRQKYRRAIIKFQTALALLERLLRQVRNETSRATLRRSRATFLYVLGRTYEYDRQWYRAYRQYQKSLQSSPAAKIRRFVKARMEPLVQGRLVQVTFRASPASASLALTDRFQRVHRGRGRLQTVVPPGRCVLRVKATGYRPRTQRFRAVAGTVLERRVVLRPRPVPVVLDSRPSGASITVLHNEQRTYRGVTPFRKALPPGQLTVQIQPPHGSAQVYRLRLRPGQPLQRTFALTTGGQPWVRRPTAPPRRGWVRALAWSSVGVAAATLGAGLALFFVSQNEFAQYQQKRGNPAQADDVLAHYDKGSALYTSAIVAWSLAGAATVGAVSLFVWKGGAASSPQTQVTGSKPTGRAGPVWVWPRSVTAKGGRE